MTAACRLCGQLLSAIAPANLTDEVQRDQAEFTAIASEVVRHVAIAHPSVMAPLSQMAGQAMTFIASDLVRCSDPAYADLRGRAGEYTARMITSSVWCELSRGFKVSPSPDQVN